MRKNFKVTMGIMALIFAWIILSMPMVNADPLRPSFANKTEQTGPTAGSQVIYGKTSGGALVAAHVSSSGDIGITPIVTIVTKTASQDLSAAALSYTTDFAAQTQIKGVYLKASGAISETISVTIDMAEGASYDTVVSETTLASETSFAYTPDELILSSGDELIITCTDTGGAETVYVTVKGETLN